MKEGMINELPADVLSDIFSHSVECWTSQEGVDYRYKLARNSSPFSLIAVCHLWRSVAMTMPTLWDAICPVISPIRLIEGWLSFIPAPTFDLLIVEGYEGTEYDSQHVSAVFRLVSRHYQRWRSLTLRLDPHLANDLLDFLRRIDLSTIPIIRLDICAGGAEVSQEHFSAIVSSIAAFPSLEQLILTRLGSAGSLLEDLPWARLKSIQITGMDPSLAQHVDYLSKCIMAQEVIFEAMRFGWEGENLPQSQSSSSFSLSNLTSLMISPFEHFGVTFPRPHFDPPFSLGNLTSLILSRATDPLDLLSFFNLPNIERIVLEVERNDGHRDHSSFRRFIQRSPSLRLLTIEQAVHSYKNYPQAIEADIIDWLSATYLRHLPSFQLAFPDALIAAPKILKNCCVQLPPLTCWDVEDQHKPCTFVSRTVVGWGHGVKDAERVFWTARDGFITLTEFYRNTPDFCMVGGVHTTTTLGITKPKPWL